MSVIGIDYRTQYEAAEERIRELEVENQNLKALIVGSENWVEQGAAAHLAQRISKAREILGGDEYDFVEVGDSEFQLDLRKRALDALEGK